MRHEKCDMPGLRGSSMDAVVREPIGAMPPQLL
jgi:hypothetical protein